MDDSSVIFGLLGLMLALGILWSLALARAVSQIVTNAFFSDARPLAAVEFWRYLFATTAFLLAGAFLAIILSRYDLHNPIYRYPIAILRLISVNLIAGLLVASLSWWLFKIQMRRMARFHHPNLSTWKWTGFWRLKKRKMTLEERTEFLRKMDFSDYVKSLGLPVLSFVAFPWVLFWFALMSQAPMQGFRPVISTLIGPMIPCEINLAVAGFAFGTIVWLSRRLFVWLGWIRTLV